MMRKLLMASLVALHTLAHAQTEKGQGIWTGNLGFGYNESRYKAISDKNFTRMTTSWLEVNRGVFFKDKWLIGGGLGFSWGRYHSVFYNSNEEAPILTTAMSGFVRRYLGKDKWRFFLGGGLTLHYESNYVSRTDMPKTGTKSLSVNPTTQIGATYYLSNRIGLEVSSSGNSYPFNFNFLNVGLTILTGGTTNQKQDEFDAPQTAKGRRVIGGYFSYLSYGSSFVQPTFERARTVKYGIAPSVGLFVNKNFLLGISVPFSILRNENESVFSYSLAPYSKKYFSNSRLKPYVRLEGIYSFKRVVSYNINPDQRRVEMTLSGGLAYLLEDRFIIEAALWQVNLGRNIYGKDSNFTSWDGTLSATLQPGFTINYVFD